MSRPERELLRPEEATSLEEFQARRIVEQAQIRALNSSWKDIGRIILSGFVALAAILFWGGMAFAKGGGRGRQGSERAERGQGLRQLRSMAGDRYCQRSNDLVVQRCWHRGNPRHRPYLG